MYAPYIIFMIYFDNASATPISVPVQDAFANAPIGNPSSPHAMGIEAERSVKTSARLLSTLLGCKPEEVIYTSGGTESNNLAILGAARAVGRRGGHILTDPMEHASVLQPLKQLENNNMSVTYAHFSKWASCIRKDTVLVSLSQVNNETGDINPVEALAAQVKHINPHILIHVDGAQGFCKKDISLECVDLYSFSAHKIHGLKGIGGLVVKRGVRLVPLMFGGGQQGIMRAGTENVPGIVTMAAAAREMREKRTENNSIVSAIKSKIAALADLIPNTYINRYSEQQLPHILNMSFLGVKGETLVHMLSEKGIYISTGAACRAKKNEQSPLAAFGLEPARVESAVRFSFSYMNTLDEAETVKTAVTDCVTRLRRLHG